MDQRCVRAEENINSATDLREVADCPGQLTPPFGRVSRLPPVKDGLTVLTEPHKPHALEAARRHIKRWACRNGKDRRVCV